MQSQYKKLNIKLDKKKDLTNKYGCKNSNKRIFNS